MTWTTVLLLNLGLIAGVMAALWLVSLPLKNASIVDIFWGLGFVVIAWTTHLAAGVSSRGLLLAVLTSIWGMRLAGYLAWRNIGQGEDYRYRKMRETWGSGFAVISLFTVFWLQALILWVVSLPVQVGQFTAAPLGWIDAAGVCIWAGGCIFESVVDWQLARFKADPANRGQVMDRGLWRYTRHPNYFGDFLVWWGLFLIAASGGAWWTIISPVVMSVLLMRVSGVTLLERSLKTRRRGYEDYIARTNAFFPWWPKDTSPE